NCAADQAAIYAAQQAQLQHQYTITNDQDALNADAVSVQATLAGDQQAVQTAQQNLQDTTLTAPMSGTVLMLDNQGGDSVGSGGSSSSSAAASSSSSSSASGAGAGGGSSGSTGSTGSTGGSSSGGGAFLSLGNLAA